MGKNRGVLAFFRLYQKRADWTDTASCAAIVQSYWKQQILAIRQDRANGEYVHYETRSKSSVQRKRFERFAAPIVMCTPAQLEATGEEWEPAWDTDSSVPGYLTQPFFVKWLTRYSREHLKTAWFRMSVHTRSRTPGWERWWPSTSLHSAFSHCRQWFCGK
jgi:hypothetical protein